MGIRGGIGRSIGCCFGRCIRCIINRLPLTIRFRKEFAQAFFYVFYIFHIVISVQKGRQR